MHYFNGERDRSWALVYGFLLSLSILTNMVMQHPQAFMSARYGMQIRSAFNGLVYKKVKNFSGSNIRWQLLYGTLIVDEDRRKTQEVNNRILKPTVNRRSEHRSHDILVVLSSRWSTQNLHNRYNISLKGQPFDVVRLDSIFFDDTDSDRHESLIRRFKVNCDF
jgi:hypothetical protein